jgi:hypothetical protein
MCFDGDLGSQCLYILIPDNNGNTALWLNDYTQRHKLLRMFCHSRLSGIFLLKRMPAIPDKPE